MSEPVPQNTTTVDWDHVPPTAFDSPVTWTGPYVECKLEHGSLEPTCIGDQFFPDSVPYRNGSQQRVFYWRTRLPEVTPPPENWTGLCATTHELVPLTHEITRNPTLFQTCNGGSELVVDGTIVGDAKTALVSNYRQPAITLQHITEDGAEFTIEGETVLVPADSRERIELSPREVQTEHGLSVSTRPELVVRNTGTRTVYHPAPGGEYTLFPSFDISLDEMPQPLEVPTTWAELDHELLASRLGIDLSSRPYPERILWQAFAFTAFGSNTTTSVEVTQFSSGEIAVRNR